MNSLLLHFTLEAVDGAEWVGLVPCIRRNDGRLRFSRTFPRLCARAEVEGVSERFVRMLERAIQAMGRAVDVKSAAVFYSELQGLGSRLAEQLLPAELLRFLLEQPVRHVTFCCDPRLNGVMYEGLWVGGDFLGCRFATGRELLSAAPSAWRFSGAGGALPFTARLLLSMPEDLAESDRRAVEAQTADFNRRWHARAPAATLGFDPVQSADLILAEDVLEAFRTREIVALYGHHDYDSGSPASSGYRLSGGSTLTARQLLEGVGPAQVAPRLVFSLCCESAITRGWEATWPVGEQLYGLVDAAQRLGVAHYIGTLVKIPALKSLGVLDRFFLPLAEGYSVGEALRRARVGFRQNPANPADGGTILGLALSLYGDPAVALVSGSGHRTAEIYAPACEGRAGSGVCGRAVAPQDPGYARRLCPEHDLQKRCATGHVLPPNAPPLRKCRLCDNLLCEQCAGWAAQLCSEHRCHEGHSLAAGLKKTCQDPQGLHPGEKRSVCPLDPGWIRGLCRDCLARLTSGAERDRG